MQAQAKIPPVAYQNYPIDIYIRIYRSGAKYNLEIMSMGDILRGPIDMLPNDLKSLNTMLQDRLKTIIGNTEENQNLTDESDESLRILAEEGHLAFKNVFSNTHSLAFIKYLSAPNKKLSIQIVSEDFFLPWELIYPASLDEPLNYKHFWGMKHIISRTIVQDDRPGAFVPPMIQVGDCPKLGLLVYKGLEAVSQKEIPFFQMLNDQKKILLFILRSLDASMKQKEFKVVKEFLFQKLNLAHFACHAVYDDKLPELSYIRLENDFCVSLKDMKVYDIVFMDYPLIVMNACETGNLNPLYTSCFASYFLKHGARGVVATECPIPDSFAADFAGQLYNRLLAGEQLGKSLLASRQYFLDNHRNPLGLLYSLYGPPSIQLSQQGG